MSGISLFARYCNNFPSMLPAASYAILAGSCKQANAELDNLGYDEKIKGLFDEEDTRSMKVKELIVSNLIGYKI